MRVAAGPGSRGKSGGSEEGADHGTGRAIHIPGDALAFLDSTCLVWSTIPSGAKGTADWVVCVSAPRRRTYSRARRARIVLGTGSDAVLWRREKVDMIWKLN